MITTPRRRRVKGAYQHVDNPVRRLVLRSLDGLDTLVYALVGLAFIGAALLALVFSVWQLIANVRSDFSLQSVVTYVLAFISDLLLVLIIMEVLGTVRSYLEKGDTSVKPFLFIGIISATRGVLSIGARLSIQGAHIVGDEFNDAMIELAINAFVIIALGVTIRVLGKAADQPETPDAPESESAERVSSALYAAPVGIERQTTD